jgi:hypothetical protein
MKGLVLDFSGEKSFKVKSLQRASKREELEELIQRYWSGSVDVKIDTIYTLSDILLELFGFNKELCEIEDGFPDSDTDLLPKLKEVFNHFQTIEYEKAS